MDSFRVPSAQGSRSTLVVDFERVEQYLAEQDRRVIRCQRASARRIARLRNQTAHDDDVLPAADLEVLQEILEIASLRVRRRLTERFIHDTVHQLSRGIRNHEHRRRVRRIVQSSVPFQRLARARPMLSTDQQDHQHQGENVVHEQMATLQGDHRQERVDDIVNEQMARLEALQLQDTVADHRQERVDDIVNEQMARLEALQLQDTVAHHPVLPPDDDVKDVEVADASPGVTYMNRDPCDFKSWRIFEGLQLHG